MPAHEPENAPRDAPAASQGTTRPAAGLLVVGALLLLGGRSVWQAGVRTSREEVVAATAWHGSPESGLAVAGAVVMLVGLTLVGTGASRLLAPVVRAVRRSGAGSSAPDRSSGSR